MIFPGTLDDLSSRGVDLAGLQIKKGEKSFFWAGKYHGNMNDRDTLDTQLNVLADFDPVLPEHYRQSPSTSCWATSRRPCRCASWNN
jgi:hypothetical protein